MTYDANELERIFSEQLRAIASALTELGADYMLIGGLAVGVWGEARATKGADIAVRIPQSDASVEEAIAKAGLEVIRGDLQRAIRVGEAVRLRRSAAQDEPVVVDLLFATTPFEFDAFRRSVRTKVLGVDLPVVGAEDLFVFKLIAGRPQDLADAHLLFEQHGETFDAQRVRKWCADFGAEERLAAFTPSEGVDPPEG